MTSSPSAPESETPEVDAVLTAPDGAEIIVHGLTIEALATLARSLERRLSLAQTEIKGLRAELDEAKADLEEEAPARFQLQAALGRAQKAQSRIAELEKDAARLDWLHSELKLTIAHALHWPVTPQDTVSFRAKIDTALKVRA